MNRFLTLLSLALLALMVSGCSMMDCGCGAKKATPTCEKGKNEPAKDGETCGMSKAS